MSDWESFTAQVDVSRETLDMLKRYAGLLRQWNSKINLVSPRTLDSLWSRHFLDSAQLLACAPSAGHWVDLGSGGGFPGAVVAILSGSNQRTTLIESDRRKVAFLRAVARETVPFTVISDRIEEAVPQNADVVSARALAPLPVLLDYVSRHLSPSGLAVLPKGRKADDELREALEHWRFDCETYPSKTDPDAVILTLGEIKRV
jgi:16S rRNA (guanine527-N7)-methyltransferase